MPVDGIDDRIPNSLCIGAEQPISDRGCSWTEDGERNSVVKGDDLGGEAT